MTRVSRGRRIAVWTLIVLGGLILLIGSLTTWVKRQLLDTDTWVDSSSALLDDPEVRNALATYAVDELFSNVDVAARLQERLPDRADALAQPAVTALYETAIRTADAVLATPQVQEVWAEVNRRAHTRLVDVLEGNEGGRITTEGGDVVLDLSDLITRIAERLGVAGDLPEGAGEIVVMRSDQLALAQDGVRTVKVLSSLVTLVVLGIFGLAVWLARGWRRKVLMAASVTVLVVGALLLVARRVAGDAIVDALVSTTSVEPAAATVWLIQTEIMRDIGVGLIIVGALFLLGAWLAGPARPAVAVRRALSGPFRGHPGAVYSVYALLVALILLVGPALTLSRAVALLVLALFGALGIEALRRQTIDEFPERTGPGIGFGRRRAQDAQLDRLERLRALHESGALTETEYQEQKGAILGGT